MTSSCLLQNVITAILHGQHGGMISAIHKKKQGHVLDGLCNSPLKLILRLFYWVSDSERTSLFFFFKILNYLFFKL